MVSHGARLYLPLARPTLQSVNLPLRHPPTNKTGGGGDGLAADYPISEDFYYTQADSPGHAVTSP